MLMPGFDVALIVPLPPSEKQHRIVAKVDDLISLYDRLEASLTAAESACVRLIEALLVENLKPVAERELEPDE